MRASAAAVLALAPLLLASPLRAQDRRHVTEPVEPATCTTLAARLAAPAGVLSEADEGRPDTARIQAAVDACPAGRAVRLSRRGTANIFLSGPLRLKAGVTLVIDAHTALFGSRDPRDYDVEPGSCGILAEMGRRGAGCKPLLLAEDAPGSGVMGRGAIDGRGGAVMRGQDLTWWELAKKAKVLDLHQTCPRLLVVRRSNGFTLAGLTLRNSANFHVVAERTDGFTAWGVKIETPKTARNSDGIDPSSSTNVTIAHCLIDTGDDNVAIKAGATGPTTHVTIAHNRFWNGHGMSIGSNTDGGVEAVRVTDLTIDGADNGLRIKSDRSRGGLVEDVAYENVCMRNVPNPIVLTSMYTTFPGTLLPVYRDIRLTDVRSVSGGWTTLLGLDAEHRMGVVLDNVHVDGQRPEQALAAQADVRIGPRRGSFVPSGETVSVDDRGASPGAPLACDGRFAPFPDLPEAPAAAVKVPDEDATLYVAASGNGDYWSIQRAIDVAPPEGAVISVAPGTYRESLVVTKPNIVIRSPYADARRTVILPGPRRGAPAQAAAPAATVEVEGDGFHLENVTIGIAESTTVPPFALRVSGQRASLANVPLLGAVDGRVEIAPPAPPSGDLCQARSGAAWARGVEGQRRADLGDGCFLNPILAGDHPDPSVLKDGDDYYMTFSSFDAYPGLVVWRSRDLVNWQPIGPALFRNVGSVWAPDLVKHGGRYSIYFPARTASYRSNYVVWADRISGPWSEPIDLKLPLIDPGHAVGEDGRRYLFLSGGRYVPLADDGLRTAGEVKNVYEGWRYPDDWIVESYSQEGPKILKHGEYFHMILAEGGTAGPPTGHMIVSARSKSIHGPWENSPYNPIARTLSAAERWWSKGHGTLVEGPDRRWYVVSHAYENGLLTLGRQTLLEPVEWTDDGWVKLAGRDPARPIRKPADVHGAEHGFAFSGDFTASRMGTQWSFYDGGTGDLERHRIEAGALVLKGKGSSPKDASPLWFVAGDPAYEVEVEVETDGKATAGLLVFYSRRLYGGLGFDDESLILHRYGLDRRGQKLEGLGRRVFLRLVNDRQLVSLYYSADGRDWKRYDTRMDVSSYHHNTAYDFLSLRPALYVSGEGEARFRNFRYRALP
ncbi:MAG: family 43 glycosylhydrolase [Vicinamibacteria bacterium]